MALQILPYLLTTSIKKLGVDKKVVILVATSGDTGKAALEGFKDVEGTEILVFYPEDGVSAMQKKQMTTQEGGNVGVCAIKGNFDDAQTGVKTIFTSKETADKLAENGMMFSSANSINWGRLGNILAGYYAKHMGVPVNKLICASNANNVLTDFIKTGIYDRNRPFHTTISPSMDILISSNLERLLYHLSGSDDAQIREWFGSLSKTGRYEVTDEVKKAIADEFYAGCCDDEQTKACIKEIYDEYSYTCDTHTAVAVKVYKDYAAATGDKTKTVIASTASPYKFSGSVLAAIGKDTNADEFGLVDELAEVSKIPVPASLAALKDKEVRFTKVIDKADMKDYIYSAGYLICTRPTIVGRRSAHSVCPLTMAREISLLP